RVESAGRAALRRVRIPPMMLISLVENAGKHGLSPLAEGGTIRIGAVSLDSTLRVSVADTGQGFVKLSGSGIGLANIHSRLASLYGPAAVLSLAPNVPRGFVAAIALPIVASPAADDARAGSLIRAALAESLRERRIVVFDGTLGHRQCRAAGQDDARS